VTIIVWEGENVLKVPSSAVFRSGDGWATFRREGDIAALTAVETGRRNGLEVEIMSGLSRGDEVIIHPSDRIEDGVRIKPRP